MLKDSELESRIFFSKTQISRQFANFLKIDLKNTKLQYASNISLKMANELKNLKNELTLLLIWPFLNAEERRFDHWNRDKNVIRKKSRQIRSRDFSNFAKIIFEAFFIDN